MLEKLKEEVCQANKSLKKHGLAIFTFGNVSAFDRGSGLIVIKPSGVSYDEMKPEDMVVTDLDCRIVEGRNLPSTDAPTHAALYKSFPSAGSVVHTHSTFATAWAQAGIPLPCLGTTHADYFYGSVPVTRKLRPDETEKDYEYNTGLAIAECFGDLDPDTIPAALVISHGPFIWGKDIWSAVHNAVILEEVARIAAITNSIAAPVPVGKELLDKHFLRKHGSGSYYGQKKH
jgi:L-ribulose-5-phosphate 4-epimerase